MAENTGSTLRVQTQGLVDAADAADQLILSLQRSLKDLDTCMQGTSSYWEGKSGDTCRKAFQSVREEADIVVARLRKHPEKLRAMAGTYVEEEHAAVAETQKKQLDPVFM